MPVSGSYPRSLVGILKTMVAPAVASEIACRNEPSPLSLVLVTGFVPACVETIARELASKHNPTNKSAFIQVGPRRHSAAHPQTKSPFASRPAHRDVLSPRSARTRRERGTRIRFASISLWLFVP